MKITITEKFFRVIQSLPRKQREIYLEVLLETYFDGTTTLRGTNNSEEKIIAKAMKDGLLRRKNHENSVRARIDFVKARLDLTEFCNETENNEDIMKKENMTKREMTNSEKANYNKYVYNREEAKKFQEQQDEIKENFKTKLSANGEQCLTYNGKPVVYYYMSQRYVVDIPKLKALDESIFKKVARKVITENLKVI